MRAVVLRQGKLVVDTVPDPEPQAGEVLVKSLACGICGSDLHALAHADALVARSQEAGGSFRMDPSRDVVMGHEYCAELADYGPGCRRELPPGTRVCALPLAWRGEDLHTVGYSNELPGGYGELMLLDESLLLPVPNGLSSALAALTEPFAVGTHAVAKARLEADDAALVIGCGPVGLAVIAALRRAGAEPIVAADYSVRRRQLAAALGADVVVDPATVSPWESWAEAAARPADAERGPEELFQTGPRLRPAVIFECVGVPGMLESIMLNAPRSARVIVVGVCMEEDRIQPLHGINKELQLQFVLGYTASEFAATLDRIANGEIDVAPLVTGRVGLDGVASAFAALADPEEHAKILVEPWRASERG